MGLLMALSLHKMIEKAEKLLKSGRIEALADGAFNVVGEHGTYIVVQDYTGRVSCNCLGFMKNGKCSHSTAVLMLLRSSRRKKRRY